MFEPVYSVSSNFVKELLPSKVSWQSPSNIAIVKYWGKKNGQAQIPQNPSISFTLKNAYTKTQIMYKARTGDSKNSKKEAPVSFSFLFDGKPNPSFETKVLQFLTSILPYFPFLPHLHCDISTTNSFPHSAGIASSASGMSALALCLCDIESRLMATQSHPNDFFKKASFISRLGSGSACRSVYPEAALWGALPDEDHSSNLFAIPLAERLHSNFHHFHDDILLIQQREKSVSSRAGHQLMENNPYAPVRYEQATNHCTQILSVLEAGEIDAFGLIAEQEALTLHALMMASNPPYILLKNNTLSAIEKIWHCRRTEKLPIYFTIDAGPNLHVLYPHNIADVANKFIISELAPLCEENKVIFDEMGAGPVAVNWNEDGALP